MSNEHSLPPATSLLLDIGPGVGALLVEAPARLEGSELEVVDRSTGFRTHAIVRQQLSDPAAPYSALYPQLPPGRYEIVGGDDSPLAEVVVEEAHVATAEILMS